MTLASTLRDAVGRHGDRPAFAVVGKDARSLTYAEAWQKVLRLAGALKAKGLTKGDRVATVAENSIELAILDWAGYLSGLVMVPIYPTLPADGTRYIVEDSGAKLVVVDSEKQAAKTLPLGGGQGGGSETVMLTDLDAESYDPQIEIADYDPCCIIYTSGTTGVPKGAVMPHRAFVHVAKGVEREIVLGKDDVFLSFLPMSHVYERVAGQVLPVLLGASIVYSKGLAHLQTEMKEARPTVMMCIPRFLESLRQRILDRVAKDKPIKQKLFGWMLAQGGKKAHGGFAPFAPLLDAIVAKKVREGFGGRLKYLVSGGAALAPESSTM